VALILSVLTHRMLILSSIVKILKKICRIIKLRIFLKR
jgi:hypothetical protein